MNSGTNESLDSYFKTCDSLYFKSLGIKALILFGCNTPNQLKDDIFTISDTWLYDNDLDTVETQEEASECLYAYFSQPFKSKSEFEIALANFLNNSL